MLSWRALHLAAFREATRAHVELGIDRAGRIDPIAALVQSGVVVLLRALNGVAGVYLPGNQEDGVPAGVLVNVQHPLAKQRYTAAHELGHHRKDRMAILDVDTEWLDYGVAPTTDRERLAEAFAAWFLMPRELMETVATRLQINLYRPAAVECYRLSLEVGASYRAVVNHLRDLSFITPQQRTALVQIQPGQIKEGFGIRDVAPNLRRDVWQVDQLGPGHVDGILGDVVAVDLPEIPSTGYAWQIRVPSGLTLLSDRYFERDATSYGGDGDHRFLVGIDEPGEATLRLEHKRAWETEVVDQREVTVNGNIVPAPGLVDPTQLVPAGAA